MFKQRVLLYFSVVAAMLVAGATVGQVALIGKVIEHSAQADLRLANGVATHVEATLADLHGGLRGLLADLPADLAEGPVRQRLARGYDSMFEPSSVGIYGPGVWAVGNERAASGPPPAAVLLPALRTARASGAPAATSMWRAPSGAPLVSLVVVLGAGPAWRAAVGNIRVDGPQFLSHFGFVLGDREARLQILDGAGVTLFSTEPAERYQSAVHGTYLLDRVRQGEATQLECHSCHTDAAGKVRREYEIATLTAIKGTPWSIVVRENSARLRKTWTEMLVSISAMACLILGALVGFYALLNRRVLKPLRQVARAAAVVSAATPTDHPPTVLRDEMQSLAQSFEAMLHQRHANPPPSAPPRELAAARPAANVKPLRLPAPVAPSGAKSSAQVLRERLERALGRAIDGYRDVEVVSALLVFVDGEAMGKDTLMLGTVGARSSRLLEALRGVPREGSIFTRAELIGHGLDEALLDGLSLFHRAPLLGLDLAKGEVWVCSKSAVMATHLKPIAMLIALHLQGVLERTVLANTLWHEHRQKSTILGHLFDAETDERKRIARDIHDDTAQALAALDLLLETFPLGAAPEAQAEALKTAQARVRGIIDSTDRIMKRLRPALLDDLGLVDAVRAMIENVLTTEGISVELEAPDDDLHAEPELEDAIYRVFLEAAQNVVRHADATHVAARLALVDGPSGQRLQGSLDDNGQGMREQTAEQFSERPRFGLLGMQERITRWGGGFEVTSSPLGGLRVSFWVPYRPKKKRAAAPALEATTP